MKTLPLIGFALLLMQGHGLAKDTSIVLRYNLTKGMVNLIKQSGNASLLQAMVAVDDKNNAIVIDEGNAKADLLKKKIAELDVRPEQVSLAFVIKNDNAIVSTPSVYTTVGKGFVLSAVGGCEIEVFVTHPGGEENDQFHFSFIIRKNDIVVAKPSVFAAFNKQEVVSYDNGSGKDVLSIDVTPKKIGWNKGPSRSSQTRNCETAISPETKIAGY